MANVEFRALEISRSAGSEIIQRRLNDAAADGFRLEFATQSSGSSILFVMVREEVHVISDEEAEAMLASALEEEDEEEEELEEDEDFELELPE